MYHRQNNSFKFDFSLSVYIFYLAILLQSQMRRTNFQVQPYLSNERQMHHFVDPFTEMRQMMMSFNMPHQDPFLKGMIAPFVSDPYEDMFNFSDIHKNVHQRGTQGSYFCQTYVSSSKLGPDGKIQRQNYFENQIGEHRGGNTISQKHQAYKNNDGINRIAEERMLNDKGRKIVKEKRGNDIEETNHYFNIDEEEAQQFDESWRRTNKSMNFLDNHQKYIRGYAQQPNNLPRAIQSYQPFPQHRNQRPMQSQPRIEYRNQKPSYRRHF